MFAPISGLILSDAGYVYTGTFAADKTEIISYLSTWQNNVPLYVYENIIKDIFHLTSISQLTNALYTVINIINYDLGFLFLTFMMKRRYGPAAGMSTLFVCFLVLGLNNQMYQFYTTALSWPATCLGLYLYIRLKEHTSRKIYCLTAFLFGISLCWGYLVRPSSIIYVIAIVIFEIINIRRNKEILMKKAAVCVFVLCGFLAFQTIFQFAGSFYTLPLDESKHAVMAQYLAYGASGDGAGSSEVRAAIADTPDQETRKETAISIWISELKSMGPVGYCRFLIKKHALETRDGTYGLTNPHIEEQYSSNPLIHLLQDIWYSNGRFVAITSVFMQAVYLLLLLGVIVSIRINDPLSFVLKLSLIGWHMFLLIFEGARTGYTIQAFPVMIPLAVLGYLSLYKRARLPFVH